MRLKLMIILLIIPVFFILSCISVPEGIAFIFSYDFSDKVTKLPVPTAQKLPSSWKGFNLLDMFYQGSTWGADKQFNEDEFKMISEWGFNFVRIPIDYRFLFTSNNWNRINERGMKRIDKAVEYGIKYDIHVCLNLHRAPGYTVASPSERTSLWTDEKPQEAFARLWGFLAERYKNIPNEYLSFNFINEPSGVDEAVYTKVIKKAAEAIWTQDPHRLLISDGLEFGRVPSEMIKELGIAQATRGYDPFGLTHYKADWVPGSSDWSLPAWPAIMAPKFLYGIGKSGITRSVYSIEHDFYEDYLLDVNVGTVSHEARLIVKANEKIIYNRLFTSGAGKGEWTTVVYQKEWDIYQNIFNRDYRIEIPAGTSNLTLEVTDGDWMTINDMKFSSVSGSGITFNYTPNSPDWNVTIPPVKIDSNGYIISENAMMDKQWLWETNVKQWKELMDNGGGVMVGEWGSHNQTPHDVVLRWMEDNLLCFREADMGWALWNLIGSIGVINSGRADVEYENYNGYKLDRKMLDLLQKYID